MTALEEGHRYLGQKEGENGKESEENGPIARFELQKSLSYENVSSLIVTIKRRTNKAIKLARICLCLFVVANLVVSTAWLLEKDDTLANNKERNELISRWHYVLGAIFYCLFVLLLVCVL